MARTFEFNAFTLSQARLRQRGLCACCGEDLTALVEHDHHVIPNQSGRQYRPLLAHRSG
jgi:hypothetical protein